MGGEKDTVEKQGGKRGKPEQKRTRRTSYVGMGPDEYLSLSYTERVELGLDEDEVPEGPDRLTGDDMGRHGGFIIRSRQVSQGQQKKLEMAPAMLDGWKLARDQIDTATAKQTLDHLVELFRGALDGFDEAKMLALAEPTLDTLSTIPFERPIDIALRKLGTLQAKIAELEPVPKQVGPWEFRNAQVPMGRASNRRAMSPLRPSKKARTRSACSAWQSRSSRISGAGRRTR